jgi:hypothetical protein
MHEVSQEFTKELSIKYDNFGLGLKLRIKERSEKMKLPSKKNMAKRKNTK